MKLKNSLCTGMMAQWIKAAMPKSDNTKSIIRMHTVKGENSRKLTPDLHTHIHEYTHIDTDTWTYIYTYTQINVI